ncbi:prenyltransferase/squalene oxidase repeat-containing protein [Streptomyces sp. NPDC051940]|uniref:prenyltransferase/squalene oxidase repeat-containing protein n=1 Tax=Streptomyces sp. NPDC051940 TaxID=3155675 RepID=UPI00341A00C6
MASSSTRRALAALAATAALCAVAAPAATAADGAGLYGTADPQYDGVWRTSLAMLAQDAAGIRPAEQAVTWLTGQQCADGGFAAYRKDTAAACDAKTEDSNATAMAVQALAALGGQDAAVGKAVTWLKGIQNKDGGFPYNPGGGSDANSTSVAIGALAAAGEEPSQVLKGEKSPFDALAALQLPCDAKADEQGAYAFTPDKGKLYANEYATAAAALAGRGTGLVVKAAGDAPVNAPACADNRNPDGDAEAADDFLAKRIAANEGFLKDLSAKNADPNTTAWATLALAAGGHKSAALEPYAWLEKNSAAWSKDSPAALGTLILTAQAVGKDPKDFAGTDLVAALNATGPAPQAAAASTKPSPKAAKEDDGDDDGGMATTTWLIIGVGLIAGVGVGIFSSLRKKNARL